MRTLQRGGSNVYWSTLETSLDIPPFSRDELSIFGSYRGTVELGLSKLGLEATIARAQDDIKIGLLDLADPVDAEQIIRRWASELMGGCGGDPSNAEESRLNRKREEFLQFMTAVDAPIDAGEFRVRSEPPPEEFEPLIATVLLASRLREVRALTGFRRVYPAGDKRAGEEGEICLNRYSTTWLPAAEVRGEGFLLQLNITAVREWEKQPLVLARCATLSSTDGDRPLPKLYSSPRFVLIHSLAHALMRTLVLECGYSGSALQERLYVGPPESEMAAVLIYTGAADSEGTLGGLVRQGRRDTILQTLERMLEDASWCSSDPLCITSTLSLSTQRNLAACHACLLAPETSCEQPAFNGFLDRALLIGTPEDPNIGYFSGLQSTLQDDG